MEKRIAILRGINVGGKRKILMADLKELFAELGFKEIITYIQSGNVIFSSNNAASNLEIGNKIEHSISKKYGFEVPVIIRTVRELNEAIASNLFAKNNDVDRLHLTFLKEIPKAENLQPIKTFDFSPDKFTIKKGSVFVYCSGKYSDSKLTNQFFESKLKVATTTRNWKTVLKLSELSKSN